MVAAINTSTEFEQILDKNPETVALFFHGDFSSVSQKTLETVKQVSTEVSNVPIYHVNVSQIKELHKKYNVKNVPTMVIFRDKQPVEWVQGEQNKDYYKNILSGETLFMPKAKDGQQNAKPNIIVYSTPTCTYCVKLKKHLDKHGFPYRDIDVSKDSKAADDLMKKTGQTGVPQSYINGQHIMGFDQKKIDKLLGISA